MPQCIASHLCIYRQNKLNTVNYNVLKEKNKLRGMVNMFKICYMNV